MANEIYKTRDIGTASYFIAEGLEMLDTVEENGIIYFAFKDKEVCEKMEKDYRFNGARVEARSFYDAVRQVKQRLYLAKGNQHGRQ